MDDEINSEEVILCCNNIINSQKNENFVVVS